MAREAAGIYNAALRNGVNPAFVAGLAGAESSFGTAGYAVGSKNPYGYGVYLNKKYPTYAAATDAMTKSLSGSLYKGSGLTDIQSIINKYTPTSDGNDPVAHVRNIKNLGGRTGGDAGQVFVTPGGQAVANGQVVSSSAEETGTQAAAADQNAQQDPKAAMEQSIVGAVAGRQPGQSVFKTVVQGVVAAQFATQFQGQPAGSSPTQGTRPSPVDNPASGEGSTVPTKAALARVGTPYSWGGGSPSGPTTGIERGANTVGFDCSSLVQYAWAKAGVTLPRTTYDQIKVGKAVPNVSQAKPGDLMFPSTGHVQMYLGNGKVVEAPFTGGKVRVTGLRSSYIAIRRPG